MMLLCHSMPDVVSATYSTNLVGGGFLNSTQDGLYDGHPARVARIQWANTAGTSADWVAATLTFSAAARIRVVAVLGLTVPAGTELIGTLLDGATEVAAQSEAAVPLGPAGAIGAIFVFSEGLDPVDRVRIQILNSSPAGAVFAAGDVFEIGEIAAMQATVVRLQADWTIDPIDPSDATLSRDSQLFIVDRAPYRLFEGTLSVVTFDEVYADGLGGQDLVGLQSAIAGDARCIAIPRWSGDTGLVYRPGVDATAMYGRGTISKVAHLGGDNYKASIVVQEIPARAP